MKKNAKKVNKSILVRLAFAVFTIYAIKTLTSYQIELITSKRTLSELHNKVSQQKISNEELQQLYDKGTDKDFIERAARDKLGYVYADEQVFIDISGK